LASCDGYRYAGIPRRQRANPITPARYRMPLASEHRLIPPIALLPMCPPKGGSNRAISSASDLSWIGYPFPVNDCQAQALMVGES